MTILSDTAHSARFSDGSIIVSMGGGTEIRFAVADNPTLAKGTAKQLNNIEISPYGLHWPELDEDLSFRGLAKGEYGQRRERAHPL
ncbi:MAG: DUF2442 domain-containing protein [Verrucomicrobiota bacterium]|nr:DUF2442 domain-containing protein [Verrucomicrobiota bacterium]